MANENLPNVIAVDDDFAVRMAMEFMFKKWPEYNLILAEDPNDALKKLEERDSQIRELKKELDKIKKNT